MKKSGKKVFVGMSGGVDSSVAAYLLNKCGYDVTGVFMRSYNVDGCAEKDAEDARRVAEKLGISFYVLDFEEEYKKRVVQYMIDGYRAGLTPNPDVMCNREIKFGLFLEKALRMGADYVATGHYVQKKCVERSGVVSRKGKNYKLPTTNYQLFAAKDTNKDQSYFLWTLTQRELKHSLFPLGRLLKPEVRKIAKKAGLPTAEKKDSQGICFLGQVTLEDFLKTYLPEKSGRIITEKGEVVGEHRGAHFYTVGQRHLGVDMKYPVSAAKTEDRKPFYVASKDVKQNTVTVVEGSDNDLLYRKEMELASVNFITSKNSGKELKAGLTVFARVRYRQKLSKATLYSTKKGSYKLVFAAPQQFVAEGQSAVFYSPEEGNLPAGRQVLGGGIIK